MTGSGVQVKGSPYHKGGEMDIDGKIGDPIKAYTDGKVVDTGWNNDYGNYVIVQDPSGKKWIYGHMNDIQIPENVNVYAGQSLLGEIGNTGNTIAGKGGDGSHLHLEQLNHNISSSNKVTYQEFAQKIKAKYPEYADRDDLALAKAMVAKYPEYAGKVELPGAENGQPDLNTNFSTAPAPTFGAGDQAHPVQGDIKDLGNEANALSGTIAGKATDAIHSLNENIKNPSVGIRTAFNMPGELVHQSKELALSAVEPVTKGIASGVRALESTPQMGSEIKQAFQAAKNGELYNSKGNKVGLLDAIKHPFDTKFVIKSNKKGEFADDIQKKPVTVGPIKQKTMAGSSNADNLQTAATAALAALGVKAPAATGGVFKGIGSGAVTGGKALANAGYGLLKGAVKGVLPTGAGILGYLLGRN